MSSGDLRGFTSNLGGALRTRRPRLATTVGVVVCLSIVAAGVVACSAGASAPAPAPTAAPAPTTPPPPPPPVPTKPAVPTAAAVPGKSAALTTGGASSAPKGAPAASGTINLAGADLFQMSCSPCHGADRGGNKFTRKGQTVSVPSLGWGDLSKTYSTKPDRGTVEQQLTLAITKGQDEEGQDLNKMMPRWSSLSKAQVDSLIAFLKTPVPATVPAPTLPAAAANLMGDQLFHTSCFTCHGAKAEGNKFTRKGQTVSVPSLGWADLSKTYSTKPSRGTVEQQLTLAITKGQDEEGEDLAKMMPRWSWLSSAQVNSLVQYLKTLP